MSPGLSTLHQPLGPSLEQAKAAAATAAAVLANLSLHGERVDEFQCVSTQYSTKRRRRPVTFMQIKRRKADDRVNPI